MVKDPDTSSQDVQLKSIIESAIFAADGPLTIADIISLFPDDAQPAREDVAAALEELTAEYSHRAVELVAVGKAFRFQTREQFAPWLRKMHEIRPPRYSRALLETLAIIAYRQPVTRGDIEEIRGVSLSSDTMRAIFDRGWIREVGHRDVPGKPALLATTRKFLEYFGLQSLQDLPPLQELRTMQEIAREMNLELPFEVEQHSLEAAEDPGDDEQPIRSAEIISIDAVSSGEKDADGDREAS